MNLLGSIARFLRILAGICYRIGLVKFEMPGTLAWEILKCREHGNCAWKLCMDMVLGTGMPMGSHLGGGLGVAVGVVLGKGVGMGMRVVNGASISIGTPRCSSHLCFILVGMGRCVGSGQGISFGTRRCSRHRSASRHAGNFAWKLCRDIFCHRRPSKEHPI